MSETLLASVERLAPEHRERIGQLLEISPYFSSLMANTSDARLSELLNGAPLLPDASAPWVPSERPADTAECQRLLRQARAHGMRHILWWELGLQNDIEASARHLALWADALLQAALEMAVELIAPRHGRLPDGKFAIIGLGKLGGSELNFGSDVDLLFIWDAPQGAASDGRRPLAAGEYYGQLARMLIRLMSEHTAWGICWPVDMRLRPGGDGAPIALSLAATLDHYHEYGQTWERAMLLKARPVAGDAALGQAFIEGISPFIYRRYLDYTTVQALAAMKRRIDAQGGESSLDAGFNVKKGHGGIREIEFFIQSLQLLHGGRNEALRLRPSMQAAAALAEAGIIDTRDAEQLHDAYRFWRRIEHAVQAQQGKQTHSLPDQFEAYLSAALQQPDIMTAMQAHAAFVHELFDRQFAEVEGGGDHVAWLELSPQQMERELGGIDASEHPRIEAALAAIRGHLDRGLLPERSRNEVERIISFCMHRWQGDANAVHAAEELARIIQNIAGRATWIDLLATNEGVTRWLADMLSASQYIATHIAANPAWLEWALEPGQGTERIDMIHRQLAGLDPDALGEEAFLADLGRLVDQTRLTAAVEVASHDDADPLHIGSWLATTADLTTQAAIRLALHQFNLDATFPFVALALGKHGSRTMGLVSDLDMVFILTHPDPATEGPKGKSMREWSQRVGRRVIQHLTTAPPFGAGFHFDARLRPSGASGVLVTTLNGFTDYQQHEAQTWEHQALCRARCVAGPEEACAQVMQVIDEVLARPRDPALLATEVREMRARMVEHLASRSAEQINLKQDPGALVDIEFLAQYARLAFGGSETNTVRILGNLPEAAPGPWHEAATWLSDTFLAYRRMENALRVHLWASIGRLPADDGMPEWETLRRHAPIKSVAELKETMHRVRATYNALLGAD
jgi:glutamate-ammonia-ligase adenylyltransferase